MEGAPVQLKLSLKCGAHLEPRGALFTLKRERERNQLAVSIKGHVSLSAPLIGPGERASSGASRMRCDWSELSVKQETVKEVLNKCLPDVGFDRETRRGNLSFNVFILL